jgi:hypothetical protein
MKRSTYCSNQKIIIQYVFILFQCPVSTRRKENPKAALNYATRSLELAQKYGLKEQISDANLKLSELYEKAGIRIGH